MVMACLTIHSEELPRIACFFAFYVSDVVQLLFYVHKRDCDEIGSNKLN